MRKKFILTVIKYGPLILSITCSLKILLSSYGSKYKNLFDVSVNYTNWILNVILLIFFYISGEYFGFCWKHQCLCRYAGWGYLFYLIFSICKTPHEFVQPLAEFYLVFVILTSIIWYSK